MRRADPLLIDQADLGLVTDLYQITMLAAYRAGLPSGRWAAFELWFRELPPERSFLLAAGLEPALAYLLALRFGEPQLDALRRLPALARLGDGFLSDLAALRFTGDVWAVREGMPVFAGEPVLRIEAPIEEAQLVETYLLATMSFSTMVASKAARVRLAAGPSQVVDFGSRRAHGPQAGCWAARSAYLAGLDGTSNVWAAARLGIPGSGTMAHSFVLSFPDEQEAFLAYNRTFPDSTVLLVDTFDTLRAVDRASRNPELRFVAIRLDSGELGALARSCRSLLDANGRREVSIVASGDLDEHRIAELVAAQAPIDAYGVGTRMVTSSDAPSLQAVYKLVEIGDGVHRRGVAKRSEGKATRPCAKQVWRRRTAEGRAAGDVVSAAAGPPTGAWEPLLEPWMRAGRLVRALPDLEASRRRALAEVASLPAGVKDLRTPDRYPVEVEAT